MNLTLVVLYYNSILKHDVVKVTMPNFEMHLVGFGSNRNVLK